MYFRLAYKKRLEVWWHLLHTLALRIKKIALFFFAKRMARLLAELTGPGIVLLLSRRGPELVVVSVPRVIAAERGLGGADPHDIILLISSGAITRAIVIHFVTGDTSIEKGRVLLKALSEYPIFGRYWLETRQMPSTSSVRGDESQAVLWRLLDELHLIDFHALGHSRRNGCITMPPFNHADTLPSWVPANPRRRSVLFSQNCYYNFNFLADALRRRGWDAVSLSTVSPDHPDRRFLQGEDLNLFDADPLAQERKLAEFFGSAASRFGIVHGYGVGSNSLFSRNRATENSFKDIPWDLLELKRRGVLLGYSHSGCLDGVSQSAFRSWSPTMCANCVWENEPHVCSDDRNLAWGRKLAALVDLFCTETDPALDFKAAANVFRGPLTFAIDPERWRPDLEVPVHLRRDRAPGEILVYHAVGNYHIRSKNTRNVKGSDAVMAAIKQLQEEGIPIRLDFVHAVPSHENRFVQVQADIIVDQLHYGRYGATAREGMMLGKPVVGRVDKMDGPNRPATQCIQETPIVHADTNTVADVLRGLALDAELRAEIGVASRNHAIKWWSPDRLAERFEVVYDHLRAHGRPPVDYDVL